MRVDPLVLNVKAVFFFESRTLHLRLDAKQHQKTMSRLTQCVPYPTNSGGSDVANRGTPCAHRSSWNRRRRNFRQFATVFSTLVSPQHPTIQHKKIPLFLYKNTKRIYPNSVLRWSNMLFKWEKCMPQKYIVQSERNASRDVLCHTQDVGSTIQIKITPRLILKPSNFGPKRCFCERNAQHISESK